MKKNWIVVDAIFRTAAKAKAKRIRESVKDEAEHGDVDASLIYGLAELLVEYLEEEE